MTDGYNPPTTIQEACRIITRLVACHDYLAEKAGAERNCKTVREASQFIALVSLPRQIEVCQHGVDRMDRCLDCFPVGETR